MIYQKYYQHHLKEEHAQLSNVSLDDPSFVSQCFEKFKLSEGDTYHEILTNFTLLESIENVKTKGESKRDFNKFFKTVMDLVSFIIYSLSKLIAPPIVYPSATKAGC